MTVVILHKHVVLLSISHVVDCQMPMRIQPTCCLLSRAFLLFSIHLAKTLLQLYDFLYAARSVHNLGAKKSTSLSLRIHSNTLEVEVRTLPAL